MKKLLSIFAILVAVMLTPSCQKELPDGIKNVEVSKGDKTPSPSPTPSPTPTPTPTPELKVSEPGQFGAKGGVQTITITATEAWTLSKSEWSDWLVVKKTSGSAGTTQVDVEAKENTDTKARTATITVKSETGSQTVNVIQSGAEPVLQLNINDLSFTANAGSDSFTITSNIDWTITSSQAWCTVSTSSGSNNSTITVNVSENSSFDSRSATITVKAGDLVHTITVIQAGAAVTLQVRESSLSFGSSGGSDYFAISSNASWTVSSNRSWCTFSSSSGSGDATVTVRVSENSSTDSRTATVTVRAGDLSHTIAVTQSGAESVDQGTRTFTANGVSFNMIRVDGGTFTMGATSEQGDDAWDNEKPTHSVTLSSYRIGETEVTQALWQAVMGSNPSYFSGSNKPVECVSWEDCQDFIRRLNALTGENFRLPTEAEWEYAARGGNKSRGYKYAGSNTIGNVAWYGSNNNGQTHNVATKSPNELGLYDMSGNVWEWCQDWSGSYSSGSQTNPTGPTSGYRRVHRGGGRFDDARGCRVSGRGADAPARRSDFIGLRLAL